MFQKDLSGETKIDVVETCCDQQQQNESAGPMRNHIVTEYRRELAASAVAFRPVNKGFGCLLLLSIKFPIPSQKIGNVLVNLLILQVSMGSRDHLPSGDLMVVRLIDM
ncbi:hypothetical protein EVAR_22698_1 [Eumeta japonica]|uniref:Uncharacterized protein n=1 Tax=Eumeta variegata TaxID=151549 RepID=A0A4C1UTG2_EUMVA|nr:hypothetical protein EVAR_22698_1 [Eumeta japonica]